MKVLYDFHCRQCGSTQEELTPMDTKTIPCDCGDSMNRVISPVRSMLEGHSGHFPDAAARWEKQHIDEAKRTR